MVQANKELANISDVDLYANSADFRAYAQKYKNMGFSDAEALKYARIELAQDVGLANAALGGAAAFVAAGATAPLRHISMAKGLQGIRRASVAEGTEEGLTGFGQSSANNAIASEYYDPERRLTEGTGQEIALSAILGAIAGGTGATPFAVRNSLVGAQASLAQRKEARQAKKQALEAQKAAQKFWNIVMEFTNGDMSLLPELMKFNDQLDEQNEWTKKQRIANAYIQPALEIYFQNAGVDPFKEQ